MNYEIYSVKARKKLYLYFIIWELMIIALVGRLFYIQCFKAEFYQELAYEQQTRDRLISPVRGKIEDRNGTALADVKSVASVSVIHAQVKEPEKVATALAEKLELDYDEVLKKVNQRVALVRIKQKVDKKTADEIKALGLSGVVIDEDILRIYPFNNLASHVLGFVGKDNQGIIGLEAKYDEYLKGKQGKILTQTDGGGREIKNSEQDRIAPVDGYNLVTTLDSRVQSFAEQTLEKVIRAKGAKRGAVIMMNPQNGEIYAMVCKPDFNCNTPYKINDETLAQNWNHMSQKDKNDALNKMWRNFNINDTYEPGSTFKVITSCAGLQEGAVKPDDNFNCGGGRTVAGRYIKCWRSPRSHGSESFVQGVQNSCNPVFMDVAARLGGDKFFEYMQRFGFDKKTGIDLPGEAVGIMHKKEDIGPVELATMSFGQSFQITPLQLVRAVSAAVNGGYLVTPHIADRLEDNEGNTVKTFDYPKGEQILTKETSDTMREILESVVYVGTGNKTYIPGYRIGGKTATSEKLPRRSGKYIASFCSFAPAENPKVVTIILVDEPQGVYYGGTVVGPVMKELLQNTLPYLGVEPVYNDEELKKDGVAPVTIEDYTGMSVTEVKQNLTKQGLNVVVEGEGKTIMSQFPQKNEKINQKSKIILYTD
jgi:stage V sporulation protein D (sporulation-specific penicillin-binding protein)